MMQYKRPHEEVSRLFDILFHFQDKWPTFPILASKRNEQWVKIFPQEAIKKTIDLAAALMQNGLQRGDRIGIWAGNSPEWILTDYAIQMAGGITVPIYPTLPDKELFHILIHADIRTVFTGTSHQVKRLESSKEQVPFDIQIISFQAAENGKSLASFIETPASESLSALYARMNQIQPQDIATILYTSGTTGTPKGVMLSHDNIISNFKANAPFMPVQAGCRALSFLPLCHILERMCSSLFMHEGVSIWFAEGMDKISDNLKEVQPHVFTTVPRLLEKVYDKILQKGMLLKGLSRSIFDWSLRVGDKYELHQNRNFIYQAELWLARKLVFKKWQAALGGNVKAIVSGGSALQPRLSRVFWAAGIKAVEGYGLTETSPVVAVNYFDKESCQFGTVGKVIQGCKVHIHKESESDVAGEILVKGPGVMKGYYLDEAQTREVIDTQGWFHTGDIGYINSEGFLKITDRKKEIFKNSAGKYIAPQPIENLLKESRYIQNVMVVGEYQDHPAALIVCEQETILDAFKRKGTPLKAEEFHANNAEIRHLIYEEIKAANRQLSPTEKIHHFALLMEEWTQSGGELTPTQKLRRKIIAEKYQPVIDGIYRGGM
jgi:long-chain acyl-CoA synthetase